MVWMKEIGLAWSLPLLHGYDTLSQLPHLLFGAGFTEIPALEEFFLKEKKHGNIRFGWLHWVLWVTNFFS
tara:strand:- start:1612 stop:1821 length:210 start_codon:yes stop_codon:yes gene_type:complete